MSSHFEALQQQPKFNFGIFYLPKLLLSITRCKYNEEFRSNLRHNKYIYIQYVLQKRILICFFHYRFTSFCNEIFFFFIFFAIYLILQHIITIQINYSTNDFIKNKCYTRTYEKNLNGQITNLSVNRRTQLLHIKPYSQLLMVKSDRQR